MNKKKKIIATIVVVLGFVALVVGAVFLVLKLMAQPKVADGDYLVSVGNWVLESKDACGEASASDSVTEAGDCAPKVVWNFTEIGKGTLTTNNHLNDYGFEWTIVDDRLIMKTDWLYELDNEYECQLDQEKGVLTLTAGQQEYTFTSEK